ncbi:hypothetical protein QEJ31_04265 [Pigmentibacter sp. JX0631]|uniref:hypothetical protein n=1 Tax=Pigmentibacter sp. JX0631 TaxID=2976982 RepID=UPI002468D4B7|nr:hypothetical protein [Pigmentibacter sp. JX0631]WGL60810.1 hypothetical protein QEJ31_04265 [Pigmentibacter sp. JX0631]
MVIKKVAQKSTDSLASIRMFLVENSRTNSAKEVRNNVLVAYKNLSEVEKDYCSKFTADLLLSKFKRHDKFTEYLHSYIMLSAQEKDWDHTLKLYDLLLKEENSYFFIKKLSEALIELVNHEFENEFINETMLAHYLTLLVNIAITNHSLIEKNKYDRIQIEGIIDYISSNIIAMCNVNSIEIRIAAVILLNKISGKGNYNLQKILSRFGQTLLEHIFQKYFQNAESKDIAFNFFNAHFEIFISSSPYLAEMTNSVMQSQMLKNEKVFLDFLVHYIDNHHNNIDVLKSLSIHLSFLLRRSCDLNKQDLIRYLIDLIFKNLELIQNNSEILFVESFENVIEILSKVHSKNIREAINLITKYYLDKNKKQTKTPNNKIINISSKRLKKSTQKDENKSYFDEIFLLAK